MARILVVDDSPSMREVLETCLPEFGYNVVAVANGVEALEQVNTRLFDLVLSDVEMPRMNGISMCEILKATPARQHVPVVLMTGCPSREVTQRGRRAGAAAVLAKPFTWDELFVELVRHLPSGVGVT